MSVYQLAQVITAHAWNGDKSMVAICPNDNNVIIYGNCQAKNVGDWTQLHVLQAHSMVVCSIDWHPVTNKIVTCSHDINAFVWTHDTRSDTWKPAMSILRINRAALKVRWSPDGTKFAVATGSRIVPVCYYDEKNKWWISKTKHNKKHKSSILDVAWHPNSQIIATASCDFKCRIFSAYIAGEEAPVNTSFCNIEDWAFGDQIIDEISASSGWIEAVAWSPSGSHLAFCGHDSSINFVSFPNGAPFCQSLRTSTLPYTTLLFLNDDVLVAAGHSFVPDVYQIQSQRLWELLGPADTATNSAVEKNNPEQISQFKSNFALFRNKENLGSENKAEAGLATKHHNVITDLRVYSNASHAEANAFSSSGNDGRIVIWNSTVLHSALSGIKV